MVCVCGVCVHVYVRACSVYACLGVGVCVCVCMLVCACVHRICPFGRGCVCVCVGQCFYPFVFVFAML